ncbi:MAG: coiled-coil domain-containing protein, partial [Actinomycetes bacterium]
MATCPRASRPSRVLLVAACAAAMSTALVLSATSSLADPQRSLAAVKDRVAELQHKAEVATEEYNTARVKREGVELRLRTLRSRVDAKQGDVADLQDQLGGMAVATYRSGGFGNEMRLIFSDNPREFIESATALQEVSRRQAALLRKVEHARQALAADQRLLVAREAELAKIDRTLKARKAEVNTRLGKAKDLLDSLEAEQRERLEAQRREAAARAAQEARADRSTRSSGTGGSTAASGAA